MKILIALIVLATVSTPTSVGSESALADHLRPVLSYVGGSARVYFAGTCSDSEGQRQLLFPTVILQSPAHDAMGIAAVRQIVRDDPNVEVTLDRSGMLRATFGTVSTTILQTKIRTLSLNSSQQYSASAALVAIWNAPAVYAAERSLRLGVPFTVVDIIAGGAVEGAPHLPSSMQNVTVDEALDSVARTFKGVVFYGFCQQPDGSGLFDLNFYYGS